MALSQKPHRSQRDRYIILGAKYNMDTITEILYRIDWMLYVAMASITLNVYLLFRVQHMESIAREMKDYVHNVWDGESQFRRRIFAMAQAMLGGKD